MPLQDFTTQLQLFPSSRDSADWADVEPAVRSTSFFSATVEDAHVLGRLKKLVAKGLEEGWSMGEFVYHAENMLDELRAYPPADEINDPDAFRKAVDTLDDMNRLRLIFRTHNELAAGYAEFCTAFDPFFLHEYPGWRFMRMDGAKEDQKRPDHVAHEYDTRLKTDVQYWLDRNSLDQGGFGNPYGPWGFNSYMYVEPVERQECIDLGLMTKDEKLTVPEALAEWNLPNNLQQIGTASTKMFDNEEIEEIIRACEKEGISVAYDPDAEAVQVQPAPKTPLGVLSVEAFDKWLEQMEADDKALFEWLENQNN